MHKYKQHKQACKINIQNSNTVTLKRVPTELHLGGHGQTPLAPLDVDVGDVVLVDAHALHLLGPFFSLAHELYGSRESVDKI